ncbi:ribosome small subunit-dependent GTPase A [Sedimentitalea sp. CY04]|uniref:Small ribosomal subunit biogenesis GTPase RsgA n=1 Tax=Parasedimentitalea denitrificans TaxID=2211118 RepID=A0ABX0W6N6_9RHOB|nr:ribosome small subunit-dependent GTPase A [Sedimentitalea sp. CY04]NIZ60933.1 ribosome small subunit-dependent GTPase A [Sedimentitalea sp. CY04]
MTLTYSDLGWSNFFQSQQDVDVDLTPYRISAVHRDKLTGLSPNGEIQLLPDRLTGEFAVGDWVLANAADQVCERLERQTELSRRAAGTDAREQLIAANVDVLFITTSCNADFNLARLERYLALAHQSGCYPVVVLTKADVCEDASVYRKQAESLAASLTVLTLDAKNPDDVTQLLAWVKPSQTAALVGSSGVGKTTLTNGLTGSKDAVRDIREDDSKGRHTTTARYLRRMVNGGWLIDTPGMRALRIKDADEGVEEVFSDLMEIAQSCRFNDCSHNGEPGCAVTAAVKSGTLELARVERWQKLQRDEERNTETLVQSRRRDKGLGKMIKSMKRDHKGRKGY